MTATFTWVEYLANATATATPTNLNFGSSITANLHPSDHPVTAGTNSYEKWVRGHWAGTFTRIENLQFFNCSGTTWSTYEVLRFKGEGQTAYVAPTEDASTIATVTMPTTDPGVANVGIAGDTSASLTSEGDSDYIVLQNQIGANETAGSTALKTFRLQYDEC